MVSLSLSPEILQEIKKDLHLLLDLHIAVLLLTTLILLIGVGAILACLVSPKHSKKKHRFGQPNVSKPPQLLRPPPLGILPKTPDLEKAGRPITRDLVEAVAQRAVEMGRWQEIRSETCNPSSSIKKPEKSTNSKASSSSSLPPRYTVNRQKSAKIKTPLQKLKREKSKTEKQDKKCTSARN